MGLKALRIYGIFILRKKRRVTFRSETEPNSAMPKWNLMDYIKLDTPSLVRLLALAVRPY